MSLQGWVHLQKGDFCLESGSFEIPITGVTAIFGHSGSGKTTFIRCLAGFESKVEGEITIFNQHWLSDGKSLPIHQRQLGYVFQEASLFPHLTVEGNLRYGLKRAKGTSAILYEQVVNWLGIADLLTRSVLTLSGGERQRVAIGRTLLSQPKILMMDEPMASLDLTSKRAIMPYLERLRDELDIPILYISHSPEEVERLADHVIFMEAGRITGFDPIEQALNRTDTPLYQASEPRAVLLGQVAAQLEDGLTAVQVGQAQVLVPHIAQPIGSKVRIVIAAQQVSLMSQTPEQTSVLNHLPVTLETIEEQNDYSLLIRLRVQDEPWPLLAQLTKRSAKHLNLSTGQSWVAAIKSASILH